MEEFRELTHEDLVLFEAIKRFQDITSGLSKADRMTVSSILALQHKNNLSLEDAIAAEEAKFLEIVKRFGEEDLYREHYKGLNQEIMNALINCQDFSAEHIAKIDEWQFFDTLPQLNDFR